jgi:hypothetical protein
MKILARFISRMGVGVVLGVGLNGCQEGPDFEGHCANKVSLTASCGDVSVECEESPCFEECTKLGTDAAEFSDACGELWIEIYECFVEMTCEGVEAWRTAQLTGTFDYPCGKLESVFREDCPEVPLYGPNT